MTDSNIFLPSFPIYVSKVFLVLLPTLEEFEQKKRKGLHCIIRCPMILRFDGLLIYRDVSGIGIGAVVPGTESLAVN